MQKSRSPYKHLSRADAQIWTEFNQALPGFWRDPVYDLHVGYGPDLPEWLVEPWKTMALELGRRRVDVFAWHANEPYIIELKPRVGTTAVGQVISYQTLYRFHPGGPLRPLMAIIAHQVDRDARAVCQNTNIRLLVKGSQW